MDTPRASHTSMNPAYDRQWYSRLVCPLCHTPPALGDTNVLAEAAWHCVRCGQAWTTRRLATVASYAAWVAARGQAPSDRVAVHEVVGDVPHRQRANVSREAAANAAEAWDDDGGAVQGQYEPLLQGHQAL
jgi:hypothetical protein